MSSGDDQKILGLLTEAIDNRTPVVLATVVSTKRSVPRRAGAKMLVYRDHQVGTVGGGAMESRVIDAARDALTTGRTELLSYDLLDPARGDPGVCGGTADIYLEPYVPAHTVLIIGAGHVGRAVADLAHWLGYRTIVTDDREERVSEEALPNADLRHHGSVAEALELHEITEDTSVVVVSRDFNIDAAAVPLLLDTPSAYIGVMGSDRRWLTVKKQLIESGVEESDLERIHVPIGIELYAETVGEIAVSIMSEVIRESRDPRR